MEVKHLVLTQNVALENLTPEVVREIFKLMEDDPIGRKRKMDEFRHLIRTAMYNPEMREHIGLRKDRYVIASYELARVLEVRHENLLKSIERFAASDKVERLQHSHSIFDEGTYDTRKGPHRCVFLYLDVLDEYCTWWLARSTNSVTSEKFRQWMGAIKASRENISKFNSLLDTIESCYLRASEASKGLTTRFAIWPEHKERHVLKRVTKSSVHPASVIINNLQAAILKGKAMMENADGKLKAHFPECKTFIGCKDISELERVEFENINAMGGIDGADRRVLDYLKIYDKNHEIVKQSKLVPEKI